MTFERFIGILFLAEMHYYYRKLDRLTENIYMKEPCFGEYDNGFITDMSLYSRKTRSYFKMVEKNWEDRSDEELWEFIKKSFMWSVEKDGRPLHFILCGNEEPETMRKIIIS